MKRFLCNALAGVVLLCNTIPGLSQDRVREENSSLRAIYPELNISSTAYDRLGNTYVTGFFADSLQLSNRMLYSRGSLDIFLAKFGPGREVEWIKHAGGAFMDLCQYVEADTNNNIYVSGLFKGRLVFEDTAIYSSGKVRYFTAKYTDEGNLLWIKQNSKIK
jgi:hypothetical protein